MRLNSSFRAIVRHRLVTSDIYRLRFLLRRVFYKKNPVKHSAELKKNRGGDLLSHPVAQTVSSAQKGLTSVFGMGTGVSPSLKPPQIV